MKYALFLLFLTYTHANPVKLKAVPEDYRLPVDSVEVKNYDISLNLDQKLFSTTDGTTDFDGEVTILFTNKKITKEIKLHANGITIATERLTLEKVNEVPPNTPVVLTNANFESDPETDILTLTSEADFEANVDYSLKIVYKARLRTEEMYGFYRSSYIDENNNEVYLGTTQFQATHARKAFPCFDEPIYKATFEIKITHPAHLNAISNTLGTTEDVPPVAPETEVTYKITTFAPTPKMSTYLVAFIVSDFTHTESTGEVPHSVWSRNETAPLRETAVEAGPKLIVAMERITGIKYLDSPIGKMDEVAIPDFSAGAMENWGLLTYRETNLLWDPQLSSNSYLQSIKNVISHEVAHMWFGNLVTCHWWSDTFLNEGFARLYQYFATAEIEPTWELDKQFVTAQIHPMLVADAQPGATALSHQVYTQAQISGRFTSVSYNKGATILRMIQHIMGVNRFNQALNTYLTTHQSKTTTPENLWAALQTQLLADILPAGTTLATVLDSWVKKPGFPLLHVHQDGTNIQISQKRFASGTETDKWYVPIAFTLSDDATKFGTSTRAWLLPTENLTLSLNSADHWIILNNKQIGYYRVHYDDALLAKIETVLKSTSFNTIDEVNRAHLVDDVYNLARIGTYNYQKLLKFLEYLENETSYYPWNAAITAFSNILQRTGDQKIRNALSTYILRLIKKLYNSVQEPKNNEQVYTFNRVQATTWACRLGNQQCIDKAVADFKAFRASNTPVDKNLKTSIYCNALRQSTNKTDWTFLWDKYQESKLATEKSTILSTLGCSHNKEILQEYLNKSITADSGIKRQDALSVFSSVYTQNPEGVDVALDFLLINYEAINSYYESMNALNSLFNGLAGRFTVQAQVTKLENFLATVTLDDDLRQTVTNAISSAKANIELTKNLEKELREYYSIGTADKVTIGFTTITASILLVCYQMWY